MVVSVDGQDRTLGEKVARQIRVRIALQEATNNYNPRGQERNPSDDAIRR
jgi:hypothetical protein